MSSAYGRVRMAAVLTLTGAALAGCGSESGVAPKAPASPAAPIAQGPKQTGPAALTLLNDVCRALRSEAPAVVPEHPAGNAITTYVNAASPSAERMVVSLQRLAGSYKVSGLDRVLGAYIGLRATYATAATQRLDATAAQRMIETQEGVVSSAARAAQLPACAVGSR
jgi:hypothetical protein